MQRIPASDFRFLGVAFDDERPMLQRLRTASVISKHPISRPLEQTYDRASSNAPKDRVRDLRSTR
jgi:hypothetical protein